MSYDRIDTTQPLAEILWADDEIDLLRPHILFLSAKGYRVTPVRSGNDAITAITAGSPRFDLVFLDENMPGLSELDTLDKIKALTPNTPIALITKSDDEQIMDIAVGNRIADYLIKPVNPSQILLSIKKVLHSDRLITETDSRRSREHYLSLNGSIDKANSIKDWQKIYRILAESSVSLDSTQSDTATIFNSIIDRANNAFFRFVRHNYGHWISARESGDNPIMSPDVLDRTVLPLIRQEKRPVFLLLDNLTLSQWIIAKSIFTSRFNISDETLYTAILPTSTQYCRNAILSGLMPLDIASRFPELWVNEKSSSGKNLAEETMLRDWADRRQLKDRTISYIHTTDTASIRLLSRSFRETAASTDDLTVIIVNFTDMLSHSVTDNPILREIAPDDAAFRSIFLSWLSHSPLRKLIENIADARRPIVVTTDHGSIKVTNPVRISAGRDSTSAMRYKIGRNISFPPKQTFEMQRPHQFRIPAGISSSCVIAGRRDFLLYPNDFNRYAGMYAGTYQHGGISMQEMILPLVTLVPK